MALLAGDGASPLPWVNPSSAGSGPSPGGEGAPFGSVGRRKRGGGTEPAGDVLSHVEDGRAPGTTAGSGGSGGASPVWSGVPPDGEVPFRACGIRLKGTVPRPPAGPATHPRGDEEPGARSPATANYCKPFRVRGASTGPGTTARPARAGRPWVLPAALHLLWPALLWTAL